ncbi:hypothetical protein Tco_0526003 [Tanacetum coccineum]
MYGRIWYDDDVHDLRSVDAEFPAIVFNDTLTSEVALSCEPTVSPLNDNKIEFRISFDDSDDEDYTVIYDKNSFSYKIFFVDNLKTDSENDNDKVNMPSFSSPNPMVSYFNYLDYLKDFENEFPAIVYNVALTSKLDFLTEPFINPQHIDEFNLKDETSLSECDGEEQNVLYFNDLFSVNVIYPNDLKLDEDNDDKKFDIEQPSGDIFVITLPNETDFGAYAQGSNKLLKTSHDTSNMALPPKDQRHQYLRFEGLEYTDTDIADFEERLGKIYDRGGQSVFTSRVWRRLFEVEGPLVHELILELFSTFRFGEAVLGLDTVGVLQFQEGGARRRISSEGDFLGTAPSYTTIKDLMLRGMDVNSVNIPYLLTRYLRRFALGRKCEALISGGQFVARLTKHFGLLTKKRLQGLTIIVRDLPVIDMYEMVRLQICEELVDTWAWVAPRPERQPDATSGAPKVTEGTSVLMRVLRLEEEVHGLRGSMAEPRDVLDSMACDFSSFTTWTVSSLSLVMDRAGVRYTSYSKFQISYVRRTRRRTNDASTSASQRPDP